MSLKPSGNSISIYITHDIDWISPLHPFSVAKIFTHGKKWIGASRLFQPRIFISNIEKLNAYNQANGIKSIWIAGAPQKHSYQKFGLRYTSGCNTYKKIIRKLSASGAEIGLHSVSSENFSRQVTSLEKLTGNPIHFHRSHFLRYNEHSLYTGLAKHGIWTDFSLGKAREVSLPEQPVITHGVTCVPTVLFDNVFFYEKPETVFRQFRHVLMQAREARQDIAIVFHPENFAVKPALWNYYQEILQIIKENPEPGSTSL